MDCGALVAQVLRTLVITRVEQQAASERTGVRQMMAGAYSRPGLTESSLLPNRPVVVDTLALKEAMMHHAEPKQ